MPVAVLGILRRGIVVQYPRDAESRGLFAEAEAPAIVGAKELMEG